jgi:mannose-6-phosphate isomerase-like protein (cupin superfamily)
MERPDAAATSLNGMSAKPVIVAEDEREWEGWREEEVVERGNVQWRTLISAGLTPSTGLALGVARVPSGGHLAAHRHEQAEVYLVLDGTGVVTIDGEASPVRPGASVFIPGGAIHSVRSTGPEDLRFAYVFAADSIDDVIYVFGE